MNWKLLGSIFIVISIIFVVTVVILRVEKSTVIPEYTETETIDTTHTILATHSFAQGTHQYKGTLLAPTPCHDIVRNIEVIEAVSDEIHIDFETREGSDLCVQMISKIPFDVSVIAKKNATVSMTLNGFSMQVTLEEITSDVIDEENEISEDMIQDATSSTTESVLFEEE